MPFTKVASDMKEETTERPVRAEAAIMPRSS